VEERNSSRYQEPSTSSPRSHTSSVLLPLRRSAIVAPMPSTPHQSDRHAGRPYSGDAVDNGLSTRAQLESVVAPEEDVGPPGTSVTSSHSMSLQVPVTLDSYSPRSYLHGSPHHGGSCPSLLVPEAHRGPLVSSAYTRTSSPSHLSRLFSAQNWPKSPPLAQIAPGMAREDAAVAEAAAAPAETDSLLPKNYALEEHAFYGAVEPAGLEDDLESQHHLRESFFWGSDTSGVCKWLKLDGPCVLQALLPRRRVTVRDVWERGVVQPVFLLPSVLLGLLLNVLDGLSYGK
jgi:hypothetical protein